MNYSQRRWGDSQATSILKHKGIKPYAFIQSLGLKASDVQTQWTNKLSGKGTVTKDERDLIVKTLKKLTGSSSTDFGLEQEPERFRCL